MQPLYTRTELTHSADLARIHGLPRRQWTDAHMDGAAAYYTHNLRTPTGAMTLRPIQGAALHEIISVRGFLGALGVGSGKTLLSLLAARVLGAQRPVLLLPASLIAKTRVALNELIEHWQIPRNVQMISYELLGRESAARLLNVAQPDLIIADEAHKLKSPRAGVTRRVARYMHEWPATMFVAMSGTLIKENIEDVAHLSAWALKGGSPMPLDKGTLQEWSECLAPSERSFNKINPGRLITLGRPGVEYVGASELELAQRAFKDRLQDTPGVISYSTSDVDASLYVEGVYYPVNNVTEENFNTLRTQWETPDGWALSDAMSVWRHARELALGLHYIWDPRPPPEWIEARRNWAAFVRSILSHSRTLDTELQVAHACAAGELEPHYWREWERIKPTFQIASRPIWHDDSALKACEKWAKVHKGGIVWTDHSFFARELARRTGWVYYGREGLSDDGKPIESAPPYDTVIASVKANSTGRNLQQWHRNLITAAPAGGPQWEQLIGRTHRYGQKADNVTVDFLIGCAEHLDSFFSAVNNARMIQNTTGERQKLLLADIAVEFPSSMSVRWLSNKVK